MESVDFANEKEIKWHRVVEEAEAHLMVAAPPEIGRRSGGAVRIRGGWSTADGGDTKEKGREQREGTGALRGSP